MNQSQRPFSLHIINRLATPSDPHKSGGMALFDTRCPACAGSMFPAFQLNLHDPQLHQLISWPHPVLELLVCPRCPLYMEPYWIQYGADAATVSGGDMIGEVLLDIRQPYDSHAVELWDSSLQPGNPRHMIGVGDQQVSDSALSCPYCAGPMRSLAIVDTDEQNVPLYDSTGSPASLIIGDNDLLHVSCCEPCFTLGFQWIR
jgi:hypothetical protein